MPHHIDEFAVIGLGRFGSALDLTLESLGHHVLGIDDRMEVVQSFSSQLTHVVSLDATDVEALRNIDISSFNTVVVAIGTDFEAGLLTTAALKELGVRNVVCKSVSRRQGEILHKVGADRVVLPEHDAGKRLAEELVNPALIDRFHLGTDFSIAELSVPKSFANQSLKQLHLRHKYNINVLVVRRGDKVTTSPEADFILLPRDIIVVLAPDDKIEMLSEVD